MINQIIDTFINIEKSWAKYVVLKIFKYFLFHHYSE